MRFAFFAFALAGLGLSVTAFARAQAIKDEPLGKYFFFAGVNARVDAIQTNTKKDSNPVLKSAADIAEDKGYIVVKVTMQNPSASMDRGVPGNLFGFELQDETQISETGADAFYSGQSLTDPAIDTLHPKQTVQFTYVFGGWSGSAITKMFMKKNSGGDENSVGVQYARFQIPPNYVQTLAASP